MPLASENTAVDIRGDMQFHINQRLDLKEYFYEVLNLSIMAQAKLAKTLSSQKTG
ncbi:MAG: hypothetical protein HRT88_06600 [Lentisphaeraceae bacterium]|nr:hypothetical protein [Lentisphaeraceae bacterium]